MERKTDLTGHQLGHVVSSRQSSIMSNENQQQLLVLTQVVTQGHAPVKHTTYVYTVDHK